MRISDWSSDVCSSDLNVDPPPASVNKAVSFCRKGQRSTGRKAFMPQRKSIPEQMTAIGFDVPGSAEVLKPMVRPVPQPAKNEGLIIIAAAGVNRRDIRQLGRAQVSITYTNTPLVHQLLLEKQK